MSMARSAEVKRIRNALRRARSAGNTDHLARRPPPIRGRPDPHRFQTVDPDTYSFPGYFTIDFLLTINLSPDHSHPPEEGVPPHPRLESPSGSHTPATTTAAQGDAQPGPEQCFPARCSAGPTRGPSERINEEELILPGWANELILRRPSPLTVSLAQANDQEILRFRGLPAEEERSSAIKQPGLYQLARAWQICEPCILSGTRRRVLDLLATARTSDADAYSAPSQPKEGTPPASR